MAASARRAAPVERDILILAVDNTVDPIIAAIDAVHVAYRAHMAAIGARDEDDEESCKREDEAGRAWDRAFYRLLATAPTTTPGLIALGQYYVTDANRDPNAVDARNVEHLARAIEAHAALAYLPKGVSSTYTPEAADPILAAIKRHRDGWQAFQDAPDVPAGATFGDPVFDFASDAEDEEMYAGQALLATTCTTRGGLAALLVHLDWYVLEERENLIRQAEHGAQYLAPQANLKLAMGAR